MFPSPENGVSFKHLIGYVFFFVYGLMFPSPENGVSFKLVIGGIWILLTIVYSFRPLKTGLVSNNVL